MFFPLIILGGLLTALKLSDGGKKTAGKGSDGRLEKDRRGGSHQRDYKRGDLPRGDAPSHAVGRELNPTPEPVAEPAPEPAAESEPVPPAEPQPEPPPVQPSEPAAEQGTGTDGQQS